MTKDKKSIHLKRVIEVADYDLYNSKGRKDALAKFGKKWQISDRSFDRIWKEAKEYNKPRIKKQEKAKDDVLVEKAKDAIKKNILSREKAEEILSNIANGQGRQVVKEFGLVNGKVEAVKWDIIAPTDNERVRAIDKLSEMKGWDAPTKQEITGKDGRPLNPEPITIEIIDSRDKVDAKDTNNSSI
jgi:hypothetical protein